MADTFHYYVLCHVCDGDGVVTRPSPIPPYDLEDIQCPECLGPNCKYQKTGYLYRGLIEKVE